MTNQELYIGIDLYLDRIKSGYFRHFDEDEKDYFLNNVTKTILKAILLKDEEELNKISKVVSYYDIERFYTILMPFIKTTQLSIVDDLDNNCIIGTLPFGVNSYTELTSGLLYNDVKYKVTTAGTANLTNFGYSTTPPVVGNEFTCSIANETGAGITLVSGAIYKILNGDGVEFTNFGASNNKQGTIFTSTVSGALTGATANTKLKVLAKSPTWSGTKLVAISDIKYYLPISSQVLIKVGKPIISGSLVKGKKYIINNVGTSDFTLYGFEDGFKVGYIFTSLISGTPTWNGNTEIQEVKEYNTSLVKPNELKPRLNNSFGISIESPLSVFDTDGLRVYTNNLYEIEKLYLTYIKKPISISNVYSITSDLPESMHEDLIKLTATMMSAVSNSSNYQPLKIETSKDI